MNWLGAHSRLVVVALAIPALLVVGVTALRPTDSKRSASLTKPTVRTAGGPLRNGSFSYVVVAGGFRVYDIGNGYTLVQSVTLPDASALVTPRGVAADAASDRLYASFPGSADGTGYLVAYDLRRDRLAWKREYPVDSFALTPNGRKIYAPCGEFGDCDYWYVLDAGSGRELGRISMHLAPHNTIASLDGDRVYLASAKYDRLAVVDPRTDEIIDWIGPFKYSTRPFTINRDHTLAFVTVDFLSGFEVASIETGAKLYTVEVDGFPVAPNEFPTLPITQSHGIALTPDEEEIWVADDVYDHIHVFDVRGLPDLRPRQIADIPLADSPKWINFTRDGRHAHISTGEIIDRRRRRIIALVEPSRQYVQIDWADGQPIRAYSRYGLGYGS